MEKRYISLGVPLAALIGALALATTASGQTVETRIGKLDFELGVPT